MLNVFHQKVYVVSGFDGVYCERYARYNTVFFYQTMIIFWQYIKSTFKQNVFTLKAERIQTYSFGFISSHLSVVFHPPHKSEVETSTKTVLEEDGRTAAVEAALRDDSHPVTQQVGLVHVVGGHYHGAPCNRGQRGTVMKGGSQEDRKTERKLEWRDGIFT